MNVTFDFSRALFLFVFFCLAPLAKAEPEVADSIRGYLERLDAGALPVIYGRPLEHPAVLSRVYRARDHQPLWLAGAPLEAEVPAVLAAISESVAHGFSAERYHRSAIEQLLSENPPEARLAVELLLTDAFL